MDIIDLNRSSLETKPTDGVIKSLWKAGWIQAGILLAALLAAIGIALTI
jgi:hypothetical protein